MIIPITYKYKEYPYAPKATMKSKLLGLATCIPMLIIFGAIVFGLVNDAIGMFRDNKDINNFIALISALLFCLMIITLKKKIEKRIDEGAVREAEENLRMGRTSASFNTEKFSRKNSRVVSCILILLGILGMSYLAYPFMIGTENVSNISGSELKAGRLYVIDKLVILDSYAYESSMNHQYFVALFSDKNEKIYTISFDPKKRSKIHDYIDDYIDKRTDVTDMPSVSVCVRMTTLNETKNMKKFYTNMIEGYGLKDVAEDSNLNAEYVCLPDESIIWHSINENNIFMMIFSVAILFAGIKTFRDSDSPNP